jgi:hypothetical protein
VLRMFVVTGAVHQHMTVLAEGCKAIEPRTGSVFVLCMSLQRTSDTPPPPHTHRSTSYLYMPFTSRVTFLMPLMPKGMAA